jgi:hypothetical protein
MPKINHKKSLTPRRFCRFNHYLLSWTPTSVNQVTGVLSSLSAIGKTVLADYKKLYPAKTDIL